MIAADISNARRIADARLAASDSYASTRAHAHAGRKAGRGARMAEGPGGRASLDFRSGWQPRVSRIFTRGQNVSLTALNEGPTYGNAG
jgi:hypothetical protein